MDGILPIIQTINAYLSDYVLIILLLGCGIYFSIRTRFVQVRCFGEGLRTMFGGFSLHGKGHDSGMSGFQALCTAIAAQVGTGNIVGASGAILVGGPGAIFWMWVIAFFGMATIYAEAIAAQKTRVKTTDGQVLGGPVYYIRTAFQGRGGKALAGFFAAAAILALGFFGAMVQSNSIGSTVSTALNVPGWVIGIALSVIGGFIFLGGTKRLATVVEKIVPTMALLYLVGGLIVIISEIDRVPQAFALIFKYAFRPEAILGGGFGAAIKAAISQGAKRGLFSNEAGMGSTPHAHAQANVKDPHEQGTVAMMGVFIDTFVVLTITALVVIVTMYTSGGALSSGVIPAGIDKTNLVQLAFASIIGKEPGALFVAVTLFFFAFSTILSWNLFGKINVCYLFGKTERSKAIATTVYAIIAIGFIFLGTLVSNDLVWELSDMFNQLMVIPNVAGLLALTRLVLAGKK